MNKAATVVMGGLLTISATSSANVKDLMSFLKGMAKNPGQVGAVTPCSSYAVNELLRPLAQAARAHQKNGFLRILEVGAGVGTCTEKLVGILQSSGIKYQLDVIEIDESFCTILRKKFGSNKSITIHCIDATQWKPTGVYNYIVSTLPFTILTSEQVAQILDMYQAIIKENGEIAYVELVGFVPLNKIVLQGKKRKEFFAKLKKMADFKKNFSVETVTVLRNVPPLYVHHLMFTGK